MAIKRNTKKNQLKGWFGDKTVKSYDGLTSQGKWEAAISASYGYDFHSETINQKLSLDSLIKEIAGEWSILKKLGEQISSINGFLENAQHYSDEAEKDYKKQKEELESTLKNGPKEEGDQKITEITEYQPSSVDIQWPNVKISGNYQRAENGQSPYDVYGHGTLKFEFAPLFGMTGKLDLLQLLMHTAGLGLGKFLRKVSNMSLGYKDKEGKIDKKRSYIETNLELTIGITSNVSGSLGYDIAPNLKGWDAVAKSSGITGFIGLILEGKAKVEGKVWEVKIGAGAEFKTTDESGSGSPGIQASCKPIVMNGKLSCVGTLEFTGLAIVWTLYANAGVDGASDDKVSSRDTNSGGFGNTGASDSSTAGSASKETKKEDIVGDRDFKQDIKKTGKYPLLKKRVIFGGEEPTKIGT